MLYPINSKIPINWLNWQVFKASYLSLHPYIFEAYLANIKQINFTVLQVHLINFDFLIKVCLKKKVNQKLKPHVWTRRSRFIGKSKLC